MTDSLKREPILDVIELAMSRLAQKLPDGVAAEAPQEQEKPGLGRRSYDMALANRLDELRTLANGAHGVPPAPALPTPCLRTGTMLVAMLLSIGAGAGATWLATQAVPQQPAVPAPVAPIASIAPIAVPTPVRPEVVETAAVAPAPQPSDEDQARELIENWRAAWAGRDVDAYLASYGADFTPANGQAFDAWTTARRKNISTRSSIAVATNDLTLERLDAQRMKAHFLQDYASGNYRETAQPKTLLLVRGDAGWKIAGEWQGEAPAGALGRR